MSLMFGGFNPSENTCHWKSSQIGNKGLSFNHIQYMYGTICNLGMPFGPGDIAAKFIHRLKRITIEWTPKNVTCPVGAPMDWDQAVSSWAFGLLYHQHREQRPTCRAWLLEQKKGEPAGTKEEGHHPRPPQLGFKHLIAMVIRARFETS